MAVIEFRTLGALDLRRIDGSELHSLLAQPKRLALLAYLCIATPRGFHRRDTLLGLFWPDADQTHARTSLRNALHVLRHALGETALHSRGDEEVAVNFDVIECDAVAFEERLASEEVDGALDLYRGDLLTGFFLDEVPAFERWLETQRTRLRARAAQAARIAAERRESERNFTGAVTLARRAVELTDTDERAVRRLLELLARVGDRAGALHAYEAFAHQLAVEFDSEPSDETRALVDRLRVQLPPVTPVSGERANAGEKAQWDVQGYSIEHELGRGATSTVFLARDLKHDRSVAIKVLRPDVAAVLGSDRFLAEIALTARLHHPHILPLLDSGTANRLPYYVMPRVEGETLRSRLLREKFLPVEEAIRITREVADALNYAHSRNIIHRDIKPENILLDNGHALVTDFGIARALSEAGGHRLTETGIALGTAAYMSPEQAESSVAIDARADIYALACVLYEMLTGDPPFTGSSAQAILARKATEPAPPLRAIRDTISAELERAILKALSRVPADRFATAPEFVAALASQNQLARRRPRVSASQALVALVMFIVVVGAVFARDRMRAVREARAVLTNRTLITNSGRVSYPTISPDGKTLAYLSTECRGPGCTYAVDLQDVDGSASRQLIDSVSELTGFGLEWSPDRRNILLYGRIKGKEGKYLVSTLNGTARFLGTSFTTFWADGDSLLSLGTKAGRQFWIVVSGLDGVPRDSFPVEAQANQLRRIIPVPNSRWILGAFSDGQLDNWVAFDRGGRIASRLAPRASILPEARASSDAFWTAARSPRSNLRSVVRIPFDGATGHFSHREDSVYAGRNLAFSITANGRSFVVAEGTTEFVLWKMNFHDAMTGRFPEKGRFLSATSILANELSHDGRKILVGTASGSDSQEGIRWEVIPFEGGERIPISGTPASTLWADAETLTLQAETPKGIELSLLDVRTGTRRAGFVVPDSAIGNFAALPNGGWAWVTGTVVNFYRPGDAVRALPVRNGYGNVGSFAATPDGKKLVFAGRGAKKDSIRVSAMSLPDGTVTPLTTVVGGFNAAQVLADGSILFAVWDTPDWVTVYHLSESGRIQSKVTIPRPVWAISISRDLRRAVVTVRDNHGDALMSRVTIE